MFFVAAVLALLVRGVYQRVYQPDKAKAMNSPTLPPSLPNARCAWNRTPLSGSLPPELGQLTALTILILSQNNLTGKSNWRECLVNLSPPPNPLAVLGLRLRLSVRYYPDSSGWSTPTAVAAALGQAGITNQ